MSGDISGIKDHSRSESGYVDRIHAQEIRLRPPRPKPRWFIGNAIPHDRQW